MPKSLNNKEKAILYDNRIDYYIDSNHFPAELVFSFRLPVLLPHISECYCIDTSPESFEIDLFKSSRKLIVAGTRNWITRKNGVNISDIECGKTDFYTSMIIAIEIKKHEITDVINMFSLLDEEELFRINNTLLQNVLEIVLFKYNEKSGGSSFMTPSYRECSQVILSFYINHINNRVLRCCFEKYHFDILEENEKPIKDDEFSKDIQNWRYFLNKCRYELLKNDYINSIISAAISIESYAWHIIRLNCNSDSEREDFSKDENGGHLSATALYKKLKDTNWLVTSLSKQKLSSAVQKILNPRNKIMHGEQSISISWKTQAEEIYSELTTLYANLGENINEDIFLDNIEHNPNYFIYRDFMKKCNIGFVSPQIMKEESLKIIKMLPDMVLPRVQYIKALFELDQIGDAKEEMHKALDDFEESSDIAIALFYYIKKKLSLNESISLFESIKEKNERIYTALADLYLLRYKEDKTQENYLMIIDLIKKAQNANSKYILPAYIECKLYGEIKSNNEIQLIKTIADSIQQDCFMPLLLANILISQNELDQAIQYFNLFIERFNKYHYKGLMIDFMCYPYDMEQIKKSAELLYDYFCKNNLKTNYEKEEFEELFKKPLEGICSIDYQTHYESGEMPLQNLFYRETLMIPGGYFLFK